MGKTTRYCGIDPSTKTGFVILNKKGDVVYENEFTSDNDDPQRMLDIWTQLEQHINVKTDIVCIEGFSFRSKGRRVDFQYGLGWLIRAFLHIKGVQYIDVAPKQLKKYACNNGNVKKEEMVEPIIEKWGFKGRTDNITDAYVLAKMAHGIFYQNKLLPYEQSIISDLLNKNQLGNKEMF